jgi:hypothetical protein
MNMVRARHKFRARERVRVKLRSEIRIISRVWFRFTTRSGANA